MKRWLPKVALALASVLVSVLFAEWVVSRWVPQATYAVHFAPWGFEHIPSIHFRHSSESYEAVTEIRYNGEGFRASREFAVAKEAGVFRIAVLGDSYAEGVEVNEAALHSSLLERLLSEGGSRRRVEVINAGVYAYDTCQELRLFEARVAKYRPDLVLVIYTGELRENATFCRLRNGGLEYIDLVYTPRQAAARYGMGYVKAKSHLANVALRALRGGGLATLPPQLDRAFHHHPPGWTPPRSPDLEPLLFAIVDRFDASAREAGGRLWLVFSHESPDAYALGEHAARKAIPMVDVYSYIKAHADGPAHWPIDGHWNELGHRLAAQAMAREITRRVFP